MKNQSSDKKQPSPAQTFNSRLTAYAATATGLFLIAPAAEATIQNLNSPTLSLDFSAANELNINVGLFQGKIDGYASFLSANSNHAAGSILCNVGSILRNGRSAINLSPNQAIAGSNWRNYAGLFHVYKNTSHHFTNGQFVPGGANQVKTGYVGFKALQNAQTYYGWLRIQVSDNAQGLPSQISVLADGN